MEDHATGTGLVWSVDGADGVSKHVHLPWWQDLATHDDRLQVPVAAINGSQQSAAVVSVVRVRSLSTISTTACLLPVFTHTHMYTNRHMYTQTDTQTRVQVADLSELP